ncbi:MAG TPA: thiosulfate reductase [Chromatiales bacterium]|nr:thiosulfate reductase [Chromatiales bacterium]
MFNKLSIDVIWLSLMALTLISATIAEKADPGLLVTAIIAVIIAFKGLMVVDRFMELATANRKLRFAMRLYFYVIPLLMVLTWLFPETIARLTTLS